MNEERMFGGPGKGHGDCHPMYIQVYEKGSLEMGVRCQLNLLIYFCEAPAQLFSIHDL